MTKGLLLTGWIVITLLYIAMHHGYNWLVRYCKNDSELQVVFGILYLAVNYIYFYFTYNMFITIASL